MSNIKKHYAPRAASERRRSEERLGAHVSIRGGIDLAPGRGTAIGATAIQVFTKTPNRWLDPQIDGQTARAFREAYQRCGLRGIVAHDSYLINLASPDETLRRRSTNSFVAELERCHLLGIPAVVSHPGNYIDEREAGLERNAEACTRALERAAGDVMVLFETTAGTGTSLGRSFEELAALREAFPTPLQSRVGFCVDTCHVYAAGYDLVNAYDEVWEQFDRIVGLAHLQCIHLNDSKTPYGSHRDRHELIGQGTLGAGPFRRVMQDPRFVKVVKVLETPKGDDEVTNDRRTLRRLRAYARPAPRRHR